MANIHLIICVIVLCFHQEVGAFNSSSEERDFLNALLEGTTNSTPHARMENKTVFVYLDLYQLLGVDEKEGVVNLKIWLYIVYYLRHLAWDPSTNGVEMVTFKKDTLWTPDLAIFEATEVLYDTFDKQIVMSDGSVIAKSANINLKVTCSVSVRYFPFDQQECKFSIGQWIFVRSIYKLGLDLTYADPEKLDLWSFTQSGQWHVEEPVTLKFWTRNFKNISDFLTYDMIEYELKLTRHPTYYLTVILIPAMLMGFLSILSLLLPVECGEKVSLGVTILLAQVVELLVLSDILPPSNRDDFPIAGLYVIFLIALVSISVIVCVIVSTIYFTPPCKNMPDCLTSAISSRLMDYLFIARLPKEMTTLGKGSKVEPETMMEHDPKSSQNGRVENHNDAQITDNNLDWEAKEKLVMINGIKWRTLASLIDRLFLISYTVAILVGSIYYYILFTNP